MKLSSGDICKANLIHAQIDESQRLVAVITRLHQSIVQAGYKELANRAMRGELV